MRAESELEVVDTTLTISLEACLGSIFSLLAFHGRSGDRRQQDLVNCPVDLNSKLLRIWRVLKSKSPAMDACIPEGPRGHRRLFGGLLRTINETNRPHPWWPSRRIPKNLGTAPRFASQMRSSSVIKTFLASASLEIHALTAMPRLVTCRPANPGRP